MDGWINNCTLTKHRTEFTLKIKIITWEENPHGKLKGQINSKNDQATIKPIDMNDKTQVDEVGRCILK